VEEHETFPPSVAQVETAIPAFIGYTESGLKNKPTRISSLLEYETLFGKSFPETLAVVFNEGVATAMQTKINDFRMHYAMKMYFANGGGPCYIVSVGDYYDAVNVGTSVTEEKTLLYGLELLKREDEPTLIVFPDLQGMVPAATDIADATSAARQAEKNRELADAAYSAANDVAEAADLTAPTTVKIVLEAIIAKAETYKVADPEDSEEVAMAQAAQAIADIAEITAAPAYATVGDIKNAVTAAAFVYRMNSEDAATIATATSAFKTKLVERSGSDSGIEKAYSLYNSALDQAELLKDRFVIMDVLGDDAAFRNKVVSTGLQYGAAYYPKLKTALSYDFEDGEVLVTGVYGSRNLAQLKSNNSELYNQAKKAIDAKPVILAPSSAIAGVYAKADRISGVFKAPANISLNYVVAPTVKISTREQDALNVDLTSGKSINAIRTFTGKGTLVWGARTLDGNSNEWRYVSVRRFFSMVEESVKKATERFVFEANTANTWVRVQTMIENFLNQQWQDGALAGSRPEEAYYVSVGLNKTMSAQDILEGRMNIEIGMAAVRPAEFIVLRFSHKLQES